MTIHLLDLDIITLIIFDEDANKFLQASSAFPIFGSDIFPSNMFSVLMYDLG
jgi:hypothetical protein